MKGIKGKKNRKEKAHLREGVNGDGLRTGQKKTKKKWKSPVKDKELNSCEITTKLPCASMLTLLAESAINGIKHAQFPWLSLHLHMFFPFPLFIIYIFFQLLAFLGL